MNESISIFQAMFLKLYNFMNTTEVITNSGITYLTLWIGALLMAFSVSLIMVFIRRHG